ncbi:MAG TPA: phosphate ABC transporter substrate-binding protein PstS [Fermentimonas caenicola]|jgi:phosphate transport system substrate-binding protein|uniref:phosphate ABC transporter substrate-binding protein PstS n=1 Tax=Lascolabacillus sp. TaxID=1924068 RepID=UPI000AE203B3|nr:phosphate ABC transporter substrate-binding protein PstS [Lascolabacillus sp.]MBP6175469.1 phosphate ABC transporter substrate-binding protein PstS [Fermentimonas sp.]MDI9625697.1 phosphate ABC transporter substrate-binding protein PstS [Bacteroidota bacterium]TAH61889.1 MAG: phosphate ABC transporter substrate-binding protein PstS [Fermentimonas caenicola]MBP6197614.1 phosphate ABC transporter substrate-binding protein PstS [Fermentimonas sp.]MBP7103561.1 phosphate ABC transporter substrat
MKKLFLFLLFPILLQSCYNNSATGGSSSRSTISGAGATFPYPYYNIVFRDFMRANEDKTVNYGAIGSGGGIRSLRDHSVDFGASDAFLNEKEIESMNAEVIHIATCMGGVVMAYTLEGIDSLRLTGQLISDIYLGKIKKWNDPLIKGENPDINLPDLEITPVYRSDGSGTTFNFSEYLSAISPEWKSIMGMGKSLKWPAGIAAKGNPGVAGIVQQTEGAIGYIGSEYALTLRLPTAKLKNRAGNYVDATLETISAAANVPLPDDMRATITDSDDPNAYPISLFTWVLVYKNQDYDNRSMEEAEDIVKLLNYVISPEGQKVAAQINYAPLSEQALEKNRKLIDQINYSGLSITP